MEAIFSRMAKRCVLPDADQALPGRDEPIIPKGTHMVLGNPLVGPFPEKLEQAVFALGCFWGAERRFWQQSGVYTTAVGYVAGMSPNPTYEEVCSGKTAHTEAVLVVFDPEKLTYAELLNIFWTSHNPTQGMRQGNDVGTQYRSGIYFTLDYQRDLALVSRKTYQLALSEAGFGEISTEIQLHREFFYAEDYHQQYLAKNPGGYCGLGGTGVNCAFA